MSLGLGLNTYCQGIGLELESCSMVSITRLSVVLSCFGYTPRSAIPALAISCCCMTCDRRQDVHVWLTAISYSTAASLLLTVCASVSIKRSSRSVESIMQAAPTKDAADQNFDYMFKLLIIGNSSVGKTSFLFRYSDDSFSSSFVSTVGIDFKVKTVFQQDKRIKLQIWVCLACVAWR